MIRVDVHNISKVMQDDKLMAVLLAVEKQVARDVGPAWGFSEIKCVLVPDKESFSQGAWRFVVADTSDEADAAGYHEDQSDVPIGYAFAKTTMDCNMMPSVTISHEILEMLGDPWINTAQQWADKPSPIFLSLELCDPVEDDALGYQIDGVQVSDFILPEFFIPGSNGPWDFKNHLAGPNTLTDGGYQLEWTSQGWSQRTSFRSLHGNTRFVPTRRASADFSSHYSRRIRRLATTQQRENRIAT